MSAGTGVYHSEYNKNQDKEVKFLQIWLFPNKKNVTPRYDQLAIKEMAKPNSFYQILSPSADDQGVWIHQNAWFHMGEFEAGKTDIYSLKNKKNGVYAFIFDGEVELAGEELNRRDGMGVWEVDKVEFKSKTKSKLLLMEVPMNI